MLLGSACSSGDLTSARAAFGAVEQNRRITATGYAVIDIQPSEDPAQRRLLAIRASKLDAYRALAEQVYGQYLDANTTVSDLMIVNDSFRTRVEGVIYGAELESIEPLGSDTYVVKLSLRQDIVNDLRLLYLKFLSNEPV